MKQAVRAGTVRSRGGWLIEQARRGVKAAVVANGKDVTGPTAGRSCLVVAPHPDDETLGCGVTIMRKLDAGAAVKVVIATDGRHSSHSKVISPEQLVEIRHAEALQATRRLGLDPRRDVVFLELQDQDLENSRPELSDRLAAAVDDFRPEELLVSSVLDHHPDHHVIGQVVRQLMASGAVACRVAEYPMGFWRSIPWPVRSRPRSGGAVPTAWSFVSGSVATVARLSPELVSTSGYLERKRHALDAYVSQLVNLTGEPDWWTLDELFLAHFLGRHEVFLPVTP
jgi:LmbE family N-acetylglucosaminyl deacetylase